jgi:hypothetical protein
MTPAELLDLDDAATEMQACGVCLCGGDGEFLRQPDLAPLLAHVRELEAQNTRYREREEHFASVLRVTDGGQYRADWDSAIARVVAERDAARADADASRALVQAMADALPKVTP